MYSITKYNNTAGEAAMSWNRDGSVPFSFSISNQYQDTETVINDTWWFINVHVYLKGTSTYIAGQHV